MSNIVRMGLRTLRKVAASPQLDKSGLRGPTQRLIYEGTKLGFKSISTASRGFKLVQGMGAAQRPQRKTATDLFDLRGQTAVVLPDRVEADRGRKGEGSLKAGHRGTCLACKRGTIALGADPKARPVSHRAKARNR